MMQRGRGIYRLPTGAGKTVVEAAIIAALNVPTLVMSHRLDILEHLKDTIERALKVPVGIIQGQRRELRKINVAMVQTIMSCFDSHATDETARNVVEFVTEYCQCLILDEAHHGSSDSYTMLFNRAYAAYYRFGLSATPFKGDDADMLVEAGLGKLQMSLTPSDLIKQGRLAKPYIFFVDYGDKSKAVEEVVLCHDCQSTDLSRQIRPMAAELERTVWVCTQCKKEWTAYMDNVERNLVRNSKRNRAIVDLAAREVRKNRSVLIAVTHIAHGQLLADELCKVIDPKLVQFAYSETEERKEVLAKLGRKELMVVIATSIFGEGVNVPCIPGDEKVRLLDGRRLPIEELYKQKFSDFWVYSATPDGNIIPGKVSDVVLSKKNASLVRVNLDKDKSFRCTPDHLVMMRDGSFKQAQLLVPGDSLMPLYTYAYSYSGKKSYESVYIPKDDRVKPTHWMVAENVYSAQRVRGNVIHHINFTPLDNRPENLKVMTVADHKYYHNVTVVERKRELVKTDEYRRKVSVGVRNAYLTTNLREKLSTAQKIAQNKPEKRASQSLVMTRIMKSEKMALSRNGDWKRKISETTKRLYVGGYKNPLEKFKDLSCEFTKESFIDEYIKLGRLGLCAKLKCSGPTVDRIAKFFGIRFREVLRNAIGDGRKKHPLAGRTFSEAHCRNISKAKKGKKRSIVDLPKNHSVVSVEADGVADVYDLRLVSPENNFALDCGVFVHNCLNTLITAKASDSPIDIIQLAGRVLRRAEGKRKTVIIDFLDKSVPFSARSKHRQALLGVETEYVIKKWKYEPKKAKVKA
jgi:superfamily II DNA or RNA helicase